MRICKFLCTFATGMRKFIVYILFGVFSLTYAHAETIVLRTGARVRGEIVFQNEEVVIIRDWNSGARMQYPRADVQEIVANDVTPESRDSDVSENTEKNSTKKVAIQVEVAGGPVFVPGEQAGGAVSADLLVGSHRLAGRPVFIGGGLGYHGYFLPGTKYNFLPIQVVLRTPFVEQKHAPVFGIALGYGIALSKEYIGGLYADMSFGYRCQVNPRTAVALVAFAQFQQAQIAVTEMVQEVSFVNDSGRNIVFTGVKLALSL